MEPATDPVTDPSAATDPATAPSIVPPAVVINPPTHCAPSTMVDTIRHHYGFNILVQAADAVCSPEGQAAFETPEVARAACYSVSMAAADTTNPVPSQCKTDACADDDYDCLTAFACQDNLHMRACSMAVTGTPTGLCQLYTDLSVVM